MSSFITMLISGVMGCAIAVLAAFGVTQFAGNATPDPVTQPLVDYGAR